MDNHRASPVEQALEAGYDSEVTASSSYQDLSGVHRIRKAGDQCESVYTLPEVAPDQPAGLPLLYVDKEGYRHSSTPYMNKQLPRSVSSVSMHSNASYSSGVIRGTSMTNFSPTSREKFIGHVKFFGGGKTADAFYNCQMTPCTQTLSIIDLSHPNCKSNMKKDSRIGQSLNPHDHLMIEFQGGLCTENGCQLNAREGIIVLTSDKEKRGLVLLVEHDPWKFELKGGNVLVNIFAMNHIFFKKKYHSLSVTAKTKLKCENTLKLVQGPPKSKKYDYVFRDIEENMAENSRILVIGEDVRTKIKLPSRSSVLNLSNLRLSRSPESTFQTRYEDEIRNAHENLVDDRDQIVSELQALVTVYATRDPTFTDHQTTAVTDIQNIAMRLEELNSSLHATDLKLAYECFAEATWVYGTWNEVSKNSVLLKYLAPCVTIVLDANRLTIHQLAVAFSVPTTRSYLICDTPFFWEKTVRCWKSKAVEFSKKCEPVSRAFVERLERFIEPGDVSAYFIPNFNLTTEQVGLSLLQSCFKKILESRSFRTASNTMFLKHNRKGSEAVQFEKSVIIELRRLFTMRLGTTFFCVGAHLEELGDRIESEGPLNKRGHLLISLEGLTFKSFLPIYDLIDCVTINVIMIGNFNELRKTDPNVHRLLSNMQACGLVQKSLQTRCDVHNCDVLFGDNDKDPQLGCKQRCEQILSCNHKCQWTCHIHNKDTFDETWNPCRARCEKYLPCSHRCQNRCSEACAVDCLETIDHDLPCGHSVRVQCWQTKKPENILCSRSSCRKAFLKEQQDSTVRPRGVISRLFSAA